MCPDFHPCVTDPFTQISHVAPQRNIFSYIRPNVSHFLAFFSNYIPHFTIMIHLYNKPIILLFISLLEITLRAGASPVPPLLIINDSDNDNHLPFTPSPPRSPTQLSHLPADVLQNIFTTDSKALESPNIVNFELANRKLGAMVKHVWKQKVMAKIEATPTLWDLPETREWKQIVKMGNWRDLYKTCLLGVDGSLETMNAHQVFKYLPRSYLKKVMPEPVHIHQGVDDRTSLSYLFRIDVDIITPSSAAPSAPTNMISPRLRTTPSRVKPMTTADYLIPEHYKDRITRAIVRGIVTGSYVSQLEEIREKARTASYPSDVPHVLQALRNIYIDFVLTESQDPSAITSLDDIDTPNLTNVKELLDDVNKMLKARRHISLKEFFMASVELVSISDPIGQSNRQRRHRSSSSDEDFDVFGNSMGASTSTSSATLHHSSSTNTLNRPLDFNARTSVTVHEDASIAFTEFIPKQAYNQPVQNSNPKTDKRRLSFVINPQTSVALAGPFNNNNVNNNNDEALVPAVLNNMGPENDGVKYGITDIFVYNVERNATGKTWTVPRDSAHVVGSPLTSYTPLEQDFSRLNYKSLFKILQNVDIQYPKEIPVGDTVFRVVDIQFTGLKRKNVIKTDTQEAFVVPDDQWVSVRNPEHVLQCMARI